MKPVYARRLLKVARALREGKRRSFNMESYANECGTPACAIGHYASRRDLQRYFSLSELGSLLCGDEAVGFDDYEVTSHFGISIDEAYELFDAAGCGAATTPIAAARYIEKFVKERA